MIKVLLVDDHEMFVWGVSSYLSIQDDIEVIGKRKMVESGMKRHWNYVQM